MFLSVVDCSHVILVVFFCSYGAPLDLHRVGRRQRPMCIRDRVERGIQGRRGYKLHRAALLPSRRVVSRVRRRTAVGSRLVRKPHLRRRRPSQGRAQHRRVPGRGGDVRALVV